MERAKIQRVLVTESCCIKGYFSDGSLLLLSSDARSYIHVDPDNRSSRHLTNCALHLHREELYQILKFRNLHFEDSFYASWVMEEELEQRRTDFGQIFGPKWPVDLDEAVGLKLLKVTGDLIFVFTKDQHHRLVYDPIGERISVRGPMTLIDDGISKQEILEDKVFSVHCCPSIWRPALQIATQASSQLAGHAETKTITSDEEVSRLECGESHDAKLPTKSACSDFKNPWWFCHTSVLPDKEIIIFDWTPEVLYQFFPSEGEVHAWITHDDSALLTTQKARFVKHRRRRPFREHLYAAACVPQSVLSETGKVLYSLESIAQQACLLREAGCRICDQRLPPPKQLTPSAQILEERQTPNGLFTAYKDGRIRAKFIDRTILNLTASGEACDVLLSTGERIFVSSEHPLGVEEYVTAALQFRFSAFSTRAERQEMLQLDEEIHKEMIRCRTTAALCSWMAQKRQLKFS